MFPPGRVLFVRPVKMLVKAERQGQEKRLKQAWDAVWISSQVLVAEGILVSRKVRWLPLVDPLSGCHNLQIVCLPERRRILLHHCNRGLQKSPLPFRGLEAYEPPLCCRC